MRSNDTAKVSATSPAGRRLGGCHDDVSREGVEDLRNIAADRIDLALEAHLE